MNLWERSLMRNADARLIRLEETKEAGTFGMLMKNNQIICLTLEPYHTFIEAGKIYNCHRAKSNSFGNTFEIEVAGHDYVYFHWGNWKEDTDGCPLTGTFIGDIWDKKRKVFQRGVGWSIKAFKLFKKELATVDEFSLGVTNIEEI